MKSNTRKCLLAALLSFSAATQCMAAGDAKISWASALQGSHWGTSTTRSATGCAPGNALGAPDYAFLCAAGPYGWAWVKDFKPPILYSGLLDLINSSITFAGVPAATSITEADFRRFDVIAFEGNGGSPAGAGGWESGIWFFSDFRHTYAETFNENTGAGMVSSGRRAKFKTGSIYCYQYQAFFAGAIAPCEYAKAIVSWILIDVPTDIDVHSPNFSVWLSGAGVGADPILGEGSPDPDAIGILSRP